MGGDGLLSFAALGVLGCGRECGKCCGRDRSGYGYGCVNELDCGCVSCCGATGCVKGAVRLNAGCVRASARFESRECESDHGRGAKATVKALRGLCCGSVNWCSNASLWEDCDCDKVKKVFL